MSRWEEWQRARRMRDGQESEKRRENRLPERRRWADRGGDSLRGLNRRAYARGPGQSRARFTTNRGHASLWRAMWADVGHCIPQTYVAEDGQNGFGLFMGESQIVRVYFYGRDVTWNARVLNARARPVNDVRHSHHHEDDKMKQGG